MTRGDLLLGNCVFPILLAAATPWLLASTPAQAADSTSRERVPLYLYCPKCGYETAYSPWQKMSHLPCPECYSTRGGTLILTTVHHSRANPGLSPIVIAGCVVVLTAVVGAGVLLWIRAARAEAAEKSTGLQPAPRHEET
jgi:hypothetical protein